MQYVKTVGGKSTWEHIRRNWGLYLLMLPAIVIFFCFTYLPMYGVIIAFKDFKPAQGIWGSAWAGLKYFIRYFKRRGAHNTALTLFAAKSAVFDGMTLIRRAKG